MFVTCFTYWITPFQRICNPLGLNLGICNPLCQHWLSCFFHVSVAKIMVFIQLSKPFSRIANADIQGWRITNPPELEIRDFRMLLMACYSFITLRTHFRPSSSVTVKK